MPADSRKNTPSSSDSTRQLVGIYVRGLLMGSADIVPGVSGGTVALITGIYDRLLAAIAGVNVSLLQRLLRGQWREAWRIADATFIAVLLAGIGSAVLLLARLISFLLEHYPLPVWSFFFGLVLASSGFLLRQEVTRLSFNVILALLMGTLVAGAIGLTPATSFVGGSLGFFLAGALAICAMILPGISGSFILLLIGMYTPVINAITALEIVVLAVFVAGCATGLLLFSRVLNWVLSRARESTMAVLAGFLLGSLVTLWPWQQVLATVVDRHGAERVLHTIPQSPMAYAAQHGSSELLLCTLTALLGISFILVAHKRHVVK